MIRYAVILSSFLFLSATAVSPVFAQAEQTCAALITSRCETCHYNTRICQKLETKSKSGWKRTVKNMVRYGAKLDREEQKSMVSCLNEPAPDVVELCKNN